jgi:hypothetical protein
VSCKRVVVRKATAIFVAVAILALGVIGTGLSTLYEQNESMYQSASITFKVSYGFPLAWHGYSQNYSLHPTGQPHWGDFNPPPPIYWLSLGSLLLDAAFWFAISFFVCLTLFKSAITVRKAAPKILSVVNIVVMYFFASLAFLVVGLCLSSVTQTFGGGFVSSNGIGIPSNPFAIHPYLDMGLRLFGFGIFLVAATFYQSLAREGKTSQKHFPAILEYGMHAGRFIRKALEKA